MARFNAVNDAFDYSNPERLVYIDGHRLETQLRAPNIVAARKTAKIIKEQYCFRTGKDPAHVTVRMVMMVPGIPWTWRT